MRIDISTAFAAFTNVQHGEFRFWRTTDCLEILNQPTPFPNSQGCYFENPDAPYGLVMLPPHDDEELDEYWGYPIADGNLAAVWHMKSTDVIILSGLTPPACSYFGFSNYLYSREQDEDEDDVRVHSLWDCPPGGDRCEIFASLDDSVNLHRGIQLPYGAFEQEIVLVLSPSIEPIEAAIGALVDSGIDPAIISNYSFPGAELRMGVNRSSDTMTTLMRMAFFEDGNTDYFDSSPFEVVRMEYNASVTPFSRKPLVPRDTGFDDASAIGITFEELQRDVYTLARHIVNRSSTRETLVQMTHTSSSVPDSGFECIENRKLCYADCRDTYYPFSKTLYRRAVMCDEHDYDCYKLMNATFAETDVFYVVGVNHAMTNMSVYASISIYDAAYFWGVSAVGNDVYEGSASHYISGSDMSITDTMNVSLPYLYVYEFRRSCDHRSYCQAIPYMPVSAFIPLDNPTALMERLYDNPLTHVGADNASIVAPYIIHMRNEV